MKEYFLVILFVAVALSSAEDKLLGLKDGHEERDIVKAEHNISTILGKPDSYEIHQKIDNGGLIGRPDGHEAPQKLDIKSKILLGRADGHERHHKIDNGGLEPNEREILQKIDLNGIIGNHFAGVSDGDVGKQKKDNEGLKIASKVHIALQKFIQKSQRMTGAHDGDTNDHKEPEESDDVDGSFTSDNEGDSNHDLVRCKRPICQILLSCAFGSKIDLNGCHICECLKNPCENHSCEVGYSCDPDECIHGRKCDALGFKCTRKVCRGPTPMCANRCEFGYALNKGGCDTCLCRMPPADGDKIDNGGLRVEDTKDKNSKDDEDSEDEEDSDDSDDYDDTDDHSYYYEDDNDDDDDEETKHHHHHHSKTLPSDPQAAHCGSSCILSHFCDKKQRDCKKRTKCWLQSEHPGLFKSPSSHLSLPTCDPIFWKYQPLQCTNQHPRVCWCVDVIGRGVPGTLTTVVKSELEPICKERLINSVSMVMEFLIVGEGTGKGRLNDLILTALSDLSSARKIDMELFMEPVKHVRLLCHVTLKHSNKYDLGYAVEVIRKFSNLTLNSEDFKVTQMYPARMGVVKEYAEQGQQNTIDLPWHDVFQTSDDMPSRHLMSMNRHTRSLLFATFVAMGSAIVLLMFLMVYRLYKRRGVIRHHPLPTHLPSTLSPTNLMRASSKTDKVLLVENDALDRTRVA